jgi:transposase
VFTVDQREQIRRAYFIEGKSIRQTARERHHDRRTVRKALHDAGPPRYTLREAHPRPILGPFLAVIDRWLEEDQQRPSKQRHTARWNYHRLVAEHGFRGGESTVRQYVREHRPNRPQVFIPLEHGPSEAQVDWGRAQVIMAGHQTSVRLLCFRLCYSQKSFVMAFPTERREAFFAGHVAAFGFIEGAPKRITYDNLPTAVQRVLKGGRREEQREFLRILALKEEAGEERLGQALELALRHRCLAADAVRRRRRVAC